MTQKVVVGVLELGNRFAFLKRLDGSYTFPSGKVERETLEDAVIREIKEETGVNARVISVLGERALSERSLCYFHCIAVSGDLSNCEPNKFLSVEWQSAAQIIEISGDRIFPAVLKLLESRL